MTAFFATAGPVDHLVLALSPGAVAVGPLASLDESDLRAAFDGKFFAHVRIGQAALPYIPPAGSITFISAASARSAGPGTAGLAAANGAIEAMVPPLAPELAPIRVNAVSPGIIDTPWWHGMPEDQRTAFFDGLAAGSPVGRVGRPEDVASSVLYLAGNGFVTRHCPALLRRPHPGHRPLTRRLARSAALRRFTAGPGPHAPGHPGHHGRKK